MQTQKGISTLILIIVIIVVALVAVGGVFAYQYFSAKTQPVVQTQQNQNQNNQTTQPSITVTSPIVHTTWTVGKTYKINWQVKNAPNNSFVAIWVQGTDGVGFTSTGSTPLGWTPANNLSADITVPANICGGECGASVATEKNNPYKIYIRLSDSTFSENLADSTTGDIINIVAPTNQTAGWKTYTNSQYGFTIQYPNDYKPADDKSGWPHSIILFGGPSGQSYYLAVEIWNNQSEFYAIGDRGLNQSVVFKQIGNKVISLWNVNNDSVINQIISTFKFTK